MLGHQCRAAALPTLFAVIGLVATTTACTDSTAPGIGQVELTSNQDTYQLLPGAPPPFFILKLENRSGGTVYVTTCVQGENTLAEVQYQQHVNGAWSDIEWNKVDCGQAGVATPILPQESWEVPNIIGTPPTAAGEYRARMPISYQSPPAPGPTVNSNTFFVEADFEPTSASASENQLYGFSANPD